jgi:hypothetical protein
VMVVMVMVMVKMIVMVIVIVIRLVSTYSSKTRTLTHADIGGDSNGHINKSDRGGNCSGRQETADMRDSIQQTLHTLGKDRGKGRPKHRPARPRETRSRCLPVTVGPIFPFVCVCMCVCVCVCVCVGVTVQWISSTFKLFTNTGSEHQEQTPGANKPSYQHHQKPRESRHIIQTSAIQKFSRPAY